MTHQSKSKSSFSFGRRTGSKPRLTLVFVAGIILVGLIAVGREVDRRLEGRWTRPGEWWGAVATRVNYGDDVLQWSEDMDLPYAYLMALIQLESGGRMPAGKRFEPHVYQRLLDVQSGQRPAYENLTPQDLADATDDALRNLATSWGPFQLMGYKCILLDVQIRDIRGEQAVRFGAEWINRTYGNRLRQGAFEDAFHIHNTGKAYPKNGPATTFHPDYVVRGLRLMDWHHHDLETDSSDSIISNYIPS